MGKCSISGLSCAIFWPPEAELDYFLQPPATPLWVVEGWGRALRNPWQTASQGRETNRRERGSSSEQRGCLTWEAYAEVLGQVVYAALVLCKG